MKKGLFIIIFIHTVYIICSINSNLVFGMEPSVRFEVSAGVAYNFDISSSSFSPIDPVFLDIPLNMGVNIRLIEWFSINPSFEIAFNYHNYKLAGNTIQKINLFLRIPFLVKFYPLVYRNEKYWNFYIGFGSLIHAWPLSYYVVNNVERGYSYNPSSKNVEPGNIYNPVNVGGRFVLGNGFVINDRFNVGLELFSNLLFIPYMNGYYFNRNYRVNGNVLLNFYINIGVMLSLQFETYRN